MRNGLRFVSPTDRILHIKSLPMWQDLPASDVLPLALAAREEHFDAGDVLMRAQEPASNALLLVDGMVDLVAHERRIAHLGPPHGLGFLSALAGDNLGVDVVARTAVIVLRLAREDLDRAHEQNFRLFERCVRQVAQLVQDDASAPALGESETSPRLDRSWDFVERLSWLSSMAPFHRASLESVAELTRRQTHELVEPEVGLWKSGEPSSFFLGVVEGSLSCRAAGERAGGDTPVGGLVGLVDALAQRPRSCSRVANTPTAVVRMDVESLLDVLEDDLSLRVALLRGLASRVSSAGPACPTLTGREAAIGGWKGALA